MEEATSVRSNRRGVGFGDFRKELLVQRDWVIGVCGNLRLDRKPLGILWPKYHLAKLIG